MNVDIVPGQGISATVQPERMLNQKGYDVKGANLPLNPKAESYAQSDHWDFVDLHAPDDSDDDFTKESGTTRAYVAVNSKYAGHIDLSDETKPHLRRCIDALRYMNVAVSMVTGDQRGPADLVASIASIPADHVFAGVLPGGKGNIIKKLQSQGQVVAMVGDGINDSPALACAGVGISFSECTDVAKEAADIVLVKSKELVDVIAAILLSKATLRRITVNLICSCAYNVIALPIAMGVSLP